MWRSDGDRSGDEQTRAPFPGTIIGWNKGSVETRFDPSANIDTTHPGPSRL